MTFNEAQQNAYLVLDRLSENREKLIIKAYRESYNQMSTQLKNLYIKIQEAEIPKGEYFNYMTQYKRLESLEASIYKDYIKAVNATKGIQINTNRQVFTDLYYRKLYLINWTLETDRVFAILPDNAIETAVTSNIDFWKGVADKWGTGADYTIPTGNTLSFYYQKGSAAVIEKMTTVLNQGFRQGLSYTKVAGQLKEVLGNGRDHALMVARTETTRMLNAASLANTNYARSEGIKIIRKWMASFINNPDSRHQQYDGQKEDESGNFHINGETGPYPGALSSAGQNANCKCTVIDTVAGVDPELRRGVNPETGEIGIINYNSYDKYMDGKNMKFTEKGWKQV